ncbi:MAG: sulfatase-like hydrolase/transferase [Armatimonadetes bacterium]|nr:sulfatase-like hydrolase/transferase [Armatimonadota bacterium]
MARTDRRTFLRAAASAAVAVAAGPGRAQAPARRPNLLFILTDDQRYDAMGFVQRLQGDKARFPWLRTPNLDRLAAEGAWFRNAFVVNSLCAPSRACFLTGQHSHTNGIVNNHTPFPETAQTQATLLRGAGYRTGYVGKWHMGAQSGQRPGFDYSASFVGQGVYMDCPIEVNGTKTPSKGWVDDVSTGYAEQFIRESGDKPWLLCVGFKAAHGPFEPPAAHRADYEGQEARTVPNMAKTAVYRPEAKPPTEPLGASAKVNLGYFRCLTAMDDNVGRLLKLLDDLKLADDTIVVFAGDNGFYLGEHGLGDKRSAYEESLRIPLLLRYPRAVAKGQVVDKMALNIDLAPTFLDFAGQTPPTTMQGRSWRPLLDGRTDGWRRSFFYCYYYEKGFRTTPTVTAVRTEEAKLIKYPGHPEWTELFDLKADPFELNNLDGKPQGAALREQLDQEYGACVEAIGWKIPDYADKVADDQPPAPLDKRVLDYNFDHDKADSVVDASEFANTGTARNCPRVEGRGGHMARRFDGQGYIDVPNSPSLKPVAAMWTVTVTFRAERPDGVLAARGGATNGYLLGLVGDKACFVVNAGNTSTSIVGSRAVGTQWCTLRARFDGADQVSIWQNGDLVASGKLRSRITQDPNDHMQIGADEGSPVKPSQPRFVGLIESVTVDNGELKR